MRWISLLVLTAVLAGSLPSTPAVAAEGRRPVWRPLTIGPGAGGQYVVTRNFVAAGVEAVRIVGPGLSAVEIDLNGFTLAGSAGLDVIFADGVESLTIRNGALRPDVTGDAIHIENVDQVIVEDVKIVGGDDGIYLSGVRSFSVRRNTVTDSAARGIYVDNSNGAGVIEDNVIQDVEGGGIQAEFSVVAIRNNEVREPGGVGIGISLGCDGSIISGNAIRQAGSAGIVLGNSNNVKIADNTSTRNAGSGILVGVSNFCLVSGNDTSFNDSGGIDLVSSRNCQIDGNLANTNGQAGIWFDASSDNNTYGRNTARGNGALPGACASTPAACAAPDLCDDGSGNSSFGDNFLPGGC